jgi:cystathionine gamma-lyase
MDVWEIALENGKHGLAFSSGLAATSTIVNSLVAGDHIIATGLSYLCLPFPFRSGFVLMLFFLVLTFVIDDVYGGTNRYFNRVALPFSGVTCSLVDFTDLKNVEAAITPKTKLIWMETPTNPTLKISDIKKCCEIAHKDGRNITVVVDNTFMSPYFQKPLDLGADIVMHSVTKYLNGHSGMYGCID